MTDRTAGPVPAEPRQGDSPPAALAAFLRGVERRGAVLAELQCGHADAGDAAVGAAMAGFRDRAGAMAMADWPYTFWALLLSRPELRNFGTGTGTGIGSAATGRDAGRHDAGETDPAKAGAGDGEADHLARLGSGPRAALLLRLAAGLDEAGAAAVLGIQATTYRLALQRALPHRPDGRADPLAWQRLREQIHRRIKTLPPARLERLRRVREAVLQGLDAPPTAVARRRLPRRRPGAGRVRPRWLQPLLWTLLALCALGFAATFWAPALDLLEGPAAGTVWTRELPDKAPASHYGSEAAAVTHRDFDLLADPDGLAEAEHAAFHAWLAAHGDSAPLPGAEAGPSRQATASEPLPQPVDADAAGETSDELE